MSEAEASTSIMRLTRVTITGADDKVLPEAFIALSQEFPFVEWGILYSKKLEDPPRYPSSKWREAFVDLLQEDPHIQASAHLCGRYSRELEHGELPKSHLARLRAGHYLSEAPAFQRLQINGYGGTTGEHLRHTKQELILQTSEDTFQRNLTCLARGQHWFRTVGSYTGYVNSCQPEGHDPSLQIHHASLLYDPSGGRGIETVRWPIAPRGIPMGYAGGIKPSNVETVLEQIQKSVLDLRDLANPAPKGQTLPPELPTWIDMESGVRTRDDRFDLRLVEQVLTRAQRFVTPHT